MTVRDFMMALSTTYAVDLVIGEERIQCNSGTDAFVYCVQNKLMDRIIDGIIVINYHGPCTVVYIKDE